MTTHDQILPTEALAARDSTVTLSDWIRCVGWRIMTWVAMSDCRVQSTLPRNPVSRRCHQLQDSPSCPQQDLNRVQHRARSRTRATCIEVNVRGTAKANRTTCGSG